MVDENRATQAPGLIIHWAVRYDLLVWLLTLGGERAFREKLVALAHLAPGEAILDVGCGTGTLAIAASRQVGPRGTVSGIDASPEMIARAERKARRAGAEVAFRVASAQNLPFPDAQFDAVTLTVMLHHLSRKGREDCAREVRRVLKPGGRALVVDFGGPTRKRKGILAHLHRHGHVAPGDLTTLLTDAGLSIVGKGSVGLSDLHYVLAVTPGGA